MRESLNEFIRFCIVGTIAFAADAVVLLLLTHFSLPDAVARVASLLVGMHVAYIFNSKFTYRNHRGITLATWRTFVLSNSIGAVINYLVFLGVLSLAITRDIHTDRLISITCGTGIALIFNHWANRRFAFREEA